MSLQDFKDKFKDSYINTNGTDAVNMINNFYIPALSNSISYDRNAGYFSSAIFSITYQALGKFIKNGGKMRIICNEFLSQADLEAGKKISNQDKILYDLEELLQNPYKESKTKLLCTLIQEGVLEIKICWNSGQGIFHDKTGIFKDKDGSVITFTGGINESLGGWTKNYDRITLEQSFGTGRSKVIDDEIKAFDELWSNSNNVWECVPLDEAIKRRITKSILSKSKFDDELAHIIDIEKKLQNRLKENGALKSEDFDFAQGFASTNSNKLNAITLFDHQKRALDSWRDNQNQGVLKYCTGSGKTMIAMFAIKEMLDKKKKPLIILDSISLRDQWEDEIKKYIDADIFIPKGKDIDELLKAASKNDGRRLIIMACEQSVKTKNFLDNLSIGEHIFLVADECHCLWAPKANVIIQQEWDKCPRLGLSATPEDTAWDDDEGVLNNKIVKDKEKKIDVVEFFGGRKIAHNKYEFTESFTISQAIKANVLTKYYYYPIAVKLTELEMDDYKDKTRKIIYARNKTDKNNSIDKKKLQGLFAMRASIIKNARNKEGKCIEIITSDQYKVHKINPERQSWLIYVGSGEGVHSEDDKRQIETYHELLTKNLPSVKIVPFFADKIKKKNRKKTLDTFKTTQGVLIGCQMLDQGIDIPELSMGIVLASSKNTRTFVQRRGRLLRVHNSNKVHKKEHAVIFDIIVTPDFNYFDTDNDDNYFNKIVENECERALQFANDAENKAWCIEELDLIKSNIKSRI